MPRISSYPTITPTGSDLVLISDASATGNPTKTATVSCVSEPFHAQLLSRIDALHCHWSIVQPSIELRIPTFGEGGGWGAAQLGLSLAMLAHSRNIVLLLSTRLSLPLSSSSRHALAHTHPHTHTHTPGGASSTTTWGRSVLNGGQSTTPPSQTSNQTPGLATRPQSRGSRLSRTSRGPSRPVMTRFRSIRPSPPSLCFCARAL